MIIVSYDIADNKLRTKFAKFLKKFGHRLQYSVFEIDNSDRFLDVIASEIEEGYGKKFGEMDSVIVFKFNASCDIIRYGYARHDNEDILIVQ